MCSNCIHISFSQKRIDQFSVSKTDQISKLWNSLICPAQKHTLRFGCRLYSQILSLQIAQLINITILIYSNYLTACYVRSCPAVIFKTPLHGKAAHDTVNLSALHQFFFLFPVDLDNIHLISHSVKGFCSKFNIDSCRHTILIQIIVRGIAVTAERDDGFFRFIVTVICVFASRHGDDQNPNEQNACNYSFSFHILP